MISFEQSNHSAQSPRTGSEQDEFLFAARDRAHYLSVIGKASELIEQVLEAANDQTSFSF